VSASSGTTPAARVAALRAVPLLEPLPPAALQAIAVSAVRRAYAADELISLQDEPAAGLYIVESGVVRICRVTEEGRQHIVRLFEAGSTYNEVPALDGGPNPATSIAHTDAVVSCLCRADLVRIGERHPALLWLLAGSVARHTRYLLDVVEDLATRTVRGRLANLLLAEAQVRESSSVPRQLTQEEMANRLGTVREMVGRVLRGLAAEGVIEFDRHRIVILDPQRLSELARS